MTRHRWHAILDRLPTGQSLLVAEIGVWRGDLSKQLLVARPELSWIGIDPYTTGEPGTPWYDSGSKMPFVPQADYDAALMHAAGLMTRFGSRCGLLRMRSEMACHLIADRSLDMVFIDGDHSYEGCTRNILDFVTKVKPGGWVGGHDYGLDQLGQVRRAVDEFFDGHRVELDASSTWFVRLDGAR